MTDGHPYAITLNLNVLNHLGLNLYSNVPAVLSEVVANSWDAEAKKVDIKIDKQRGVVEISDDGLGMTREEVNDRFLNVGYQRRLAPGGGVTKNLRRKVLGRKGIGKLSLFSIANVVEVHTCKDGEKSAFRMKLADLKKQIEQHSIGTYHPEPIDPDITKGTRIVLTGLKKGLGGTAVALRRRIARRFTIIGAEHKFEVRVNGDPIDVEDRDYYHKVQFLWTIGGNKDRYLKLCKNHTKHEHRPGKIEGGYQVSGWIGTAASTTALKDENDNLNRIVLIVRGKLAQEDLLDTFSEGGVYTKYLIGEIHADFLDDDDDDDIATSSRQQIIEDDPRYVALREFVLGELKNVQNKWTKYRNEGGEEKARQIPAINDWFETLPKEARRKATALFGKINQLTISDEADRRRLFQHCVLAFESLRYKEQLDALDEVTPENLESLGPVFAALDDIEATLYHQIVSERIKVIDRLRDHVEENSLENVVRDHLFEHLWLLDPSWERATDGAYMEQSVQREFDKIRVKPDVKAGRVDIKYRKTSGANVIVELKRAGRRVSSLELLEQTEKYQEKLRQLLDAAGRHLEPINVVCVVGTDLSDWDASGGREGSAKLLAVRDTRVVMYQELLDNAFAAYSAYLEKRKDAGRVQRLIEDLASDDVYTEG